MAKPVIETKRLHNDAFYNTAAVGESKLSSNDVMRMVNESAFRSMSINDIFPFRATVSNSNVDSHHTQMTPRTLDNYAADFQAGAPLLESHNSWQLPIGRIFHANRTKDGTDIYAYISRGTQKSDDQIKNIETGITRDVSVGAELTPESHVYCSVCNADMLDPKSAQRCDHMAGDIYNGQEVFYKIDNAHAFEASLVSKASTPGANIKEVVRSYYSNRGWNFSRGKTMDWKTFSELFGFDFEGVNEAEREGELIRIVRQSVNDIHAFDVLKTQTEALNAKVASLERQAALGQEYVNALIEEAVAERAKAEGPGSFDEKIFRETLAKFSDVTFIRGLVTGYKATSAKVFGDGKRPTGGDIEPEKKTTTRRSSYR